MTAHAGSVATQPGCRSIGRTAMATGPLTSRRVDGDRGRSELSRPAPGVVDAAAADAPTTMGHFVADELTQLERFILHRLRGDSAAEAARALPDMAQLRVENARYDAELRELELERDRQQSVLDALRRDAAGSEAAAAAIEDRTNALFRSTLLLLDMLAGGDGSAVSATADGAAQRLERVCLAAQQITAQSGESRSAYIARVLRASQ